MTEEQTEKLKKDVVDKINELAIMLENVEHYGGMYGQDDKNKSSRDEKFLGAVKNWTWRALGEEIVYDEDKYYSSACY